MPVSTRRRLPVTMSPLCPALPSAVSPPRRPWVPRAPTPDDDAAMIARVALERGLPEPLVRRWLGLAGELGRPLARRRSPATRIGERV
jgi:hypothetical protein